MKSIALLVGIGLLTLLGTVGCEEEHEHHSRPYGGSYDGGYQGYGHGYGHGHYDGSGLWHHDDD